MSTDFISRSLRGAVIKAILNISLDTMMVCSWCLGHVASYHKPEFSFEILHFDIENHMALHKFVINGYWLTIWKNFKYHSDFLHFFGYYICSQGFAIHSTQGLSLLHSLMESMQNVWLNFRYIVWHFLTLATILSLFLSTYLTHQLKANSWSIPYQRTNSVFVPDGIPSTQTTSTMRKSHPSTCSKFFNLLWSDSLLVYSVL